MKTLSPIAFVIAAACVLSGFGQQAKTGPSKPFLPSQNKSLSTRLNMSPVQRAMLLSWPIAPSEAAAKTAKAATEDDETNGRALFDEGMALVRAEKFEQALAKFREAEKLLPHHLATQMNIGICLMQLDRAAEAVSAFEKAAAIDPDNAAAHAMICSSRSESGDRSAAVDECRQAVKLSNGAAEYKALLGKVLLYDNSYEALAILNSISQTADSPLNVLGPLADMYVLAGQNEQAAAVYEQIKQRWPNISLTWYRLSYVYEFLDRPQQAIASARKFAELRPNSAFAHLNLGQRLAHAGFFEDSIQPLAKSVELDPGSGDAYLLLSESYKVMGDKDNTLKNLEFAYDNLPPDLAISYNLGRALTDYGRMADAVKPLERANSLRPGDPHIMTALGLAYFESNQFDPAIEILTRVDQMTPNDKTVQMFLRVAKARKKMVVEFDELLDALKKDPYDLDARDRVAAGYRYRGMWKEAEKTYRDTVAVAPDAWQTYNWMGIFYSDTGHLPEALEAFKKAAELHPNPVFYSSVSSTLEKLGRLDEAIEAERRAIQIRSAAPFLIHLGDLLVKKGDRTGAMDEFQAAFAMQPDNMDLNFAMAWLYMRSGNKEGAIRHYHLLQQIAPEEIDDLKRAIVAHFGPVD